MTAIASDPPWTDPLWTETDQLWYKRAVFYEVLVRAFCDADGNGAGDLCGLAQKLEYLSWLGVDGLWLPPFFASPMRDGGYDVSDFRAVRADHGTIADFVRLVDQAHQRDMRLVIDLVLNHTSDEHNWFQQSRHDPGGPYGDYYVWSDDNAGHPHARALLPEAEESSWTHDPVRGQYYWHRFHAHEPDLNYANPRVQDEMLDVIRFWLDLGVDGVRLVSLPYLFEAHDFVRRARKVVDDEYPGRVLVMDAGAWPTFGEPTTGGDEGHMACHVPLMPRIFVAISRSNRYPVAEILAQTPTVPDRCQWSIMLRDHNELSLGTLGAAEQDLLYQRYATDPRMRTAGGIRRRLAPLLDNDRRLLELCTGLLLSLPGSPTLYYGDEIGMGDNIWLDDADGLRTPMHWTPDRNAGFSAANPGQLYLPVLADPLYGAQAVNVEAQMASCSSLLSWTRQMLTIRRQHPAFGLGCFTELDSSNPCVLAFLRAWQDDVLLCVVNFAAGPQPVELDLSTFDGRVPVELTGGVRFPAVGELPYLLTLRGHGFYWFALEDS